MIETERHSFSNDIEKAIVENHPPPKKRCVSWVPDNQNKYDASGYGTGKIKHKKTN